MNREGHPETKVFNCPNCGASAGPDSLLCTYCGSPIATRICPSCFCSVSVAMLHCPLCGTDLADSGIDKSEDDLKCPACDTDLALARVGRHKLHECLRCGGLWIDKNSFQDICSKEEDQEAVLRFRADENTEPGRGQMKRKRAYIPCPECGKLMNHKSFSRGSGIVLDWCRNHGSWFDRKELQQIISFIRKGGLQKARERERLYIEEEKSRLRMKQYELAVRASRTDINGGRIRFDQSGDSILSFLQTTFFD